MITITDTPSKTEGTFVSRWLAAFNPIVFKAESNLFPDNNNDLAFPITTISNFSGKLEVSTILGVPDFVPGEYVLLDDSGLDGYDGVFRVLFQSGPQSVVLDLSYNADIPNVATGFDFQKYYLGYSALVRVNAGIPSGHTLESNDPIEEIATKSVQPDINNNAVIDIKELVQRKINTKNDFNLSTLPNDINIWTAFTIETAEQYQDFVGLEGTEFEVTDYSDNNGDTELTLDSAHGLVARDYVQLTGFDDDTYNRRHEVIRIVGTNGIVIAQPYDPYYTLSTYESAQKYNITKQVFTSPFTPEGNTYYAINSKLPLGSVYAGNMLIYVNAPNNAEPAEWLTNYSEKPTFKDFYDDLQVIIAKEFINAIGGNDVIAIESIEEDANGNKIATNYIKFVNLDEGVYRLPYNQFVLDITGTVNIIE